jgi:hypothetical protein
MAGQQGSLCFIVGEWIEGINLATLIDDSRPDFRESDRIVSIGDNDISPRVASPGNGTH